MACADFSLPLKIEIIILVLLDERPFERNLSIERRRSCLNNVRCPKEGDFGAGSSRRAGLV